MKHILSVLLIFSFFALSGQGIEPSSFQPSPYLNGILRAITPITNDFTGDTEYMYVHDSLGAVIPKIKETATIKLRIQNDSIRADIKKRLNRDTIGNQGIFLSLVVDSTGQIIGVSEIISDDFDKDDLNELQTLSVLDSTFRVIRIQLSDGGGIAKFKAGILGVKTNSAAPLFTVFAIPRPDTTELVFNRSFANGRTFYAGPNAAPGTTALPTFRAIVSTDIPTLNQNTTGSAATLTTGRSIAITGDLNYLSGSFNGSANVTGVGTLATVNSNVGTFTNSTITVNAKGLVTAASSGATPRDSTGFVAGWGLNGAEIDNIIYAEADSLDLMTKYDGTLKQDKLTGSNKRIPYFTGTNTLGNSDNFSFDISAKSLGIGTISPQATLDMANGGGNLIRFYDASAGTNYKDWRIAVLGDGREMNFISRSDLGSDYNFMTFRRATNSQIMGNWYVPFISSASGTSVMTIDEVGSIYRDQLKTVGGTSLFGSGNISTYNLPSLSSGSVIFSNGSDLAQDNANFFWNNSTKRLGLGTASPSRQLTTTQDISVNENDIGLGGGNIVSNARIGNAALNNNTTGSANIAIGAYSLLSNTTGYYNTAIGYQTLLSVVSGHTNTAIGQNTLVNNTGNQNTGIGTQALLNNVGGNQNTALSPFTLYSNVSGSGNIAIGYGSGYSETGSNRLYIENSTSSSPLIGGHFDNRRVGINTTITDIGRTLDVNGEVRVRDLVTTNPSGLVGRDANGVLSGVSLGTGLEWSGTTLNNTGVTGTGTSTRVAFWSGTSSLSSDANLFWDNSGKFLGVGTASPSRLLHVAGDAQINRYSWGSDGQIVSGQDAGGYYYAAGGTSVAKPIYMGNSSTTFTRIATLAGVGSRMVTANGNGDLGTAALPSLSVGTKSGANVPINITGGGTGINFTDGVGTSVIRNSGTSVSIDAIDATITNEGFLGVGSSGTNQSLLQGYNSSGTTTGTGVTFQSQQSVTMTESTSTNGGTINIGLSRPYAHLRLTGFSTSQTLSANTWAKINFENIQSSNGYSANTSSEDITIGSNNTGVAQCTFTSYFTFPASPNTGFFEVALFKNGSQINQSTITYLLSEAGRYWTVPISWTEDFTNTTDTIDVRVKSTSAMTGLTVGGANFIVQRIN
jgi:hypothetical protein